MRLDEFITAVSGNAKSDEAFEKMKRGLPLGKDSIDAIVLAQKKQKPLTIRHTCIAGTSRSAFIRRMLITISCLYEKSEACFFILSPHTEYGELLRLRSMDVTAPYIHSKADLALAVETIRELLRQREYGLGYPHLFLVLDGLDELPEANRNGDLEEYREIFDLFNRREDIDVISGADLSRSIFSGYPGAFLGIGNCLVSLREDGKADVTYVNDDASMSLPTPISYPCEPAVTESVIFLNSLPRE